MNSINIYIAHVEIQGPPYSAPNSIMMHVVKPTWDDAAEWVDSIISGYSDRPWKILDSGVRELVLTDENAADEIQKLINAITNQYDD